MTIVFTEQELSYIVKRPFNWHVAKQCPDEMRKTIEAKLAIVQKYRNERESDTKRKMTR